MASLIYRPPAGVQETAFVRVAGEEYIFSPGIARDVPNERVAAITTALQGLGGTVVAGPSEL